MYEMGYDLIVNDEEAAQMADMMTKKLELYHTWLLELIAIMDQVEENAIISGDTADNFAYLNWQMHQLISETDYVKEKIKTIQEQYLAAIDEADLNLYNEPKILFPYNITV